MGIEFYKYQGTGNDFLIIDACSKTNGPDIEVAVLAAKAQSICHRSLGVGADGLILLSKSAVTFINADGSIAENCGNGMRCVGQYLVDSKRMDAAPQAIWVGPRQMWVKRIDTDIEVEMGELTGLGSSTMEIPGIGGVKSSKAKIGNPHLVVDVRDKHLSRSDLKGMEGSFPHLSRDFNVGFILALDEAVDLAILERGAGWTGACASGACAAVGALVDWGEVAIDATMPVKQAGGQILVNVRNEKGLMRARQRGAAAYVFRGQLDLNEF